MSSKQTLMDAHVHTHVRAQQEIAGVDTLLKTWLTSSNRPFIHDALRKVYVRTRVPETPFDKEIISDRLVALLGSIGVHGITVEHDVDGAALRLTIPETQPIEAIAQLGQRPLRIHEQTARGRR